MLPTPEGAAALLVVGSGAIVTGYECGRSPPGGASQPEHFTKCCPYNSEDQTDQITLRWGQMTDLTPVCLTGLGVVGRCVSELLERFVSQLAY